MPGFLANDTGTVGGVVGGTPGYCGTAKIKDTSGNKCNSCIYFANEIVAIYSLHPVYPR